MDIEEKVSEWNRRYAEMGRECSMKDMGESEYESAVGYELLDVCDNDIDVALAVLGHDNTDGGWMTGDVGAWLERRRTPIS